MNTRHYIDGAHDTARQPTESITDSLDLAAWLVCQGFTLHRLDPPPNSAPKQHTRFVFPSTEDLNIAVSAWESSQPVLGTDLHRYINVKQDLYRRARSVAREGGAR